MSALISDNPPQIHPRIFCKYKKETNNKQLQNKTTQNKEKGEERSPALRLGLDYNRPRFLRARSSGLPAKPAHFNLVTPLRWCFTLLLASLPQHSQGLWFLTPTFSEGSPSPAPWGAPWPQHTATTAATLSTATSGGVSLTGHLFPSHPLHWAGPGSRGQPRDGVWDH